MKALVARFSDTDEAVRAEIAWALGAIEHPSAIPGLIEALENDKVMAVRRNAVRALGEVQ